MAKEHNRIDIKREVVVIYADKSPMRGEKSPGPHQIYKNPRLNLETRKMGELYPNNIRVEMLYTGICGTDLHMVQTDPKTGYILCSAPAIIPDRGLILGHEGVGRIIAVGSSVNHLDVGSYVAFESIIACYQCGPCRRGLFNQCYNARLLGLQTDGLFGSVVDVPAMLAHDVTEFSNSAKALMAMACLEPAGVAYVGCQNARMYPGDSVVVFGAGPIGLYCAMLSKRVFGASKVHVIEPSEFRRNMAREWCDEVYDVEEFNDNSTLRADVVLEASGHLKNISRIMKNMDARGRIVLLARSGERLAIDAVDHMITNAVSITGSRGHLGGAFSALMKLYANQKLPLEQLVTNVVDGPGGFSKLMESPEVVLNHNCKVMVRFNEG